MRKTYPLRPEGKHPDRVLEAVKHDIRKYLRRERRRELPEGAHFWDFDCRFGPSQAEAQTLHPGALIAELDALAKTGAEQCYVELLAKPAQRQPRPAPDATAEAAPDAASEPAAQSPDGSNPQPPQPADRPA
jgi:hypothetical protein